MLFVLLEDFLFYPDQQVEVLCSQTDSITKDQRRKTRYVHSDLQSNSHKDIDLYVLLVISWLTDI